MASKDIKLTRKQLNLVTNSWMEKKLYQYRVTVRKSWEYVSTEVFCLHFVLFCFCKGAARQGGGRKRGKRRLEPCLESQSLFFPLFHFSQSVDLYQWKKFSMLKRFFLILDLIMLLTGLHLFKHVRIFSY